MLELHGIVVRGVRSATANLATQLPQFAEKFPELAGCYLGTVNLRLDRPLRIEHPDFRADKIWWGTSPRRREDFDFTRCTFRTSAGDSHPAWIYAPQDSPHRKDPYLIEILGPKMNVRRDEACVVVIDRNYLEVPMAVV